MNITHFDHFRAGEWPVSIDMQRDTAHGNHILVGSTYCYEKWVQVRKKERTIALIIYEYDDESLPEWWQDSELLWEFRP